jgi:hypothetical protein
MKWTLIAAVAFMLAGRGMSAEQVLASFAASTEAPHGKGNLYAPDILRYGGEYLMFFGGQGKDGHDRIHLATSANGGQWSPQGVVFEVRGANHVNDPSVVVSGDRLFMFYTLAMSGITDSIALAISTNGRKWEDQGVVLAPSDSPAWDSLLVGRPSVIVEDGVFRMWYDGRKDLPIGSPDATAPKAAESRRFIGYAVSKDGRNWKRNPEPVFGENAGGVDVKRAGELLVMVIESRGGTLWASSKDGLKWEPRGLLLAKDGTAEAFGHVTPFLFKREDRWNLYYGAASATTWDANAISRAILPADAFQAPTK